MKGGSVLKKETNLQDRTARPLEKGSTFLSLKCPLLAEGILPPFLEVSRDVKIPDCGVGSEAAGRRLMKRNTNIRPGEHRRSPF